MNFRLKRILTCFLTAVLLVSLPVGALAEERQLTDYSVVTAQLQQPEIGAEGAYLVELNSGAVLYQKNAGERFYPASITKILTGLVVAEQGKAEDKVTFSYEAVHNMEEGGFSYIADTGDQLSVEDCMYAMLLASSNEAAYALAEHVGGSIEGFAEMMNQRAAEAGAVSSHFANPHGLFHEEHYTTPHDMAMIMWAAIENETFMNYDTAFSYRTAPTKTQVDGFYCQMRHQMMNQSSEYYNSAVKAGKTGHIQAAKNTLVSYAEKGDMQLICVVMKADGAEAACADTQTLLDFAFDSFAFQSVSVTADLTAMEKKASAELGRVIRNFEIGEEASALMPKNIAGMKLETVFEVDRNSVENDTAQGRMVYSFNGTVLGTDPVVIQLVTQPTQEETTAEQESGTEEAPLIGNFDLHNKTVLLIIFISLCAILMAILIGVILRNVLKRKRRRKRR